MPASSPPPVSTVPSPPDDEIPKPPPSESPPSDPAGGTFAEPAGFKTIPSPLAPIWPKGGPVRYRPKLRPR